MDTQILIHQRDTRGVHSLVLNDPANFNALGEAMIAALQKALNSVAQDTAARAVVIAAQGKAFCPGHNLKEMQARPELAYYQDLFSRCSKMMLNIAKLPVPVIAKVQGIATAAGCQLVAQCDLAVASNSARFGVNGIDVGLFCATPSVPLLRNIAPKAAMEMLVTGEFLSAEQALQKGLVNRVAAPEQLDAELEKLLLSILSKPREALAMGKQLLAAQREMGLEAAYQLAGQTMAANMMLGCAQEGVAAFVEKREPRWLAPKAQGQA
jgi:enoyl-CoA hydratase/carnithine racemase